MSSPLNNAIYHAKSGNIQKAREELVIQDEDITDQYIVDSLIDFEQAYDLLISGQHSKAVDPLKKSLYLIEKSNDSDTRFIVNFLKEYADGIEKLFSGDVVGAYDKLNISAETLEKASFFDPNFIKYALSIKAASHIALARQNLNIGHLEKAESIAGAIAQIYSDLISRLDENKEEDLALLAEANAIQLEMFNIFSSIDISVLDFDSAEKRLNASIQFYEKLKYHFPNLKDNTIKLVLEVDLILYDVLNKILQIGRSVIYEKSHLTEKDIRTLKDIDLNLYNAKNLALKAQERGRGYFYIINQLSRLQERLLIIGKIQEKHIISISGVIALVSFLILLFSVDFTINPSGYEAIFYFIGELIISLIVGFGYGAVKFVPLIRLVTEALNTKKDKVEH
jgi:hypothetical protein